MSQLAGALRYLGQYTEAEELDREATEQGRILIGAEDFNTLQAAHNWGVSLRLCGEFGKALSLDRETAQQRELLLGPTSSLTLSTLSGVGLDMREGATIRDPATFWRKSTAGRTTPWARTTSTRWAAPETWRCAGVSTERSPRRPSCRRRRCGG